jgi:superfamily II DNA or RNA helicase
MDIKKQITDIIHKLNNDIPNGTIAEEYDNFSISMIKYIKSKDKTYFDLLFDFINHQLSSKISKDIIRLDLYTRPNIHKQLVDLIIDNYKQITINKLTDIFKIKLDQSELYPPLNPLILNQSQNQVLDYYKQNNLKSGIICHATGTGKTNCIYITMGFNEPNIIFILCTYKSILKQLFYTISNAKYELNYEKFRQLKYGNYLNLWNYSIYNLADDTIDRKTLLKNLPSINKTLDKKIFLINPQFITINDRYKLLPKPDLIIHDECHSVSANNTSKFLTYFVNKQTNIIGLSATPIRYINKSENRESINRIYTSNIISSYENITAIINKDILNLEFYWFDAILDKNSESNKKNKANINQLINTIIKVYDKLPNKKLLIWCGTTKHADYINEIFNKDNSIKSKFSDIYVDHSKLDDQETDTYKEFKISKGRSILIVAEKYREGSDIEYLDCIVFADMVKVKTDIPFIQSIGRVQRIGYNKTIGYVIDHYEKTKEQIKSTYIINKLIRYYYEFFMYETKQHKQSTNISNALALYTDILKKIKFESINDDNIIRIKIIDDMNFIIHLNVDNIELVEIETKFEHSVREHIKTETNLNQNEILRFEYDIFKICNQIYKIKTKTEYNSRIDEFNYVAEPEIKYKNIWSNWYEYLGIDTSIYPANFEELQSKIKENKIKTLKQYYKSCESLNMPLMPEELYQFSNLVSIFNYDNVLVL